MNEKEAATLLAINKSNFPSAYRELGRQEVELLAKTWSEVLRELPFDLVRGAFLRALEVCRFPVTLADIFAQLRQIQAAARPTVEELWRELVKAARACHRDAYNFDFTEGWKYRERCQKRCQALPECTRAFIGNYGRLVDLGGMEASEREQFYFPRFRRFLEQYWQNEDARQGAAGLLDSARLLDE